MEVPPLPALEVLLDAEGEGEGVRPGAGLGLGLPAPARPRLAGLTPETLRRSVAGCLIAMEQLVDGNLTAALTTASHAWDGVDSALAISSHGPLAEQLRQTRGQLEEAAAHSTSGLVRVVATEGLMALTLAAELLRLFERRLSSLIRLRVLSAEDGSGGLLPEGRPFLDLAAALRDAARAWS